MAWHEALAKIQPMGDGRGPSRWNPFRELISPGKNEHHHAQSQEPEHTHSELLPPKSLATAVATVGTGPAAVPFVDSNDWEQAAAAAVRSNYDHLQGRRYLVESFFAPGLP